MLRTWLRYHLAILLILPPFLIGSVHLSVQATLAGLAALWILLIGVRNATRSKRRVPVLFGGWSWLWIAALAWTAWQLIPLPRSIISALSSETANVQSILLGAVGLLQHEPWLPLSLAPGDTTGKLIRDIGAFCLFWGVLQWCHTREHLKVILKLTMLTATVMTCLILFQTALGMTSPLLGLYHPKQPPDILLLGSPFINANHLGGYLLFHAVIGFWLINDSDQGSKRWTWGVPTLLISICIFATLSRGAILMYAVAASAYMVLLGQKLFRADTPSPTEEPPESLIMANDGSIKPNPTSGKKKRKRSQRDRKPVWKGWELIWNHNGLRIGAIVLALSMALGIQFTASHFTKEIKGFKKHGLKKDKPTAIYEFSTPLLKKYPITGVGRGAMGMVWHRYASTKNLNAGQQTVTHVESQALQPLVDWGWPFGLIYLGLMLFLFIKLIKGSEGMLERASLLAIAALALQNLFDFNLEFPGTAFPMLAVLAAIVRIHFEKHRKRQKTPQGIAVNVGSVFGIGLASLAIVAMLFPYANKHQYTNVYKQWKQIARSPQGSFTKNLKAFIKHHPADFTVPLHVAFHLLKKDKRELPNALKWLARAEQLNPTSASLYLFRSAVYARLQLTEQAALQLQELLTFSPRHLKEAIQVATHYGFERQALQIIKNQRMAISLLPYYLNKTKRSPQELLLMLHKRFPDSIHIHSTSGNWYLEQATKAHQKGDKSTKQLHLKYLSRMLTKANKRLPKDFFAYYHGRLALMQGRERVALKQFQVAAKTNGLHAWNATATLIQLQLKRKQFDIVKTMLREARDRFVGNSQVAYLHATEGNMYALLNKPGKAISAYEEALALQSLPQYWIRMAHLCWEMSRYKCAFRIMNRISKKPKYKHLQSQLTKWKKIHKERMEQAFRPFGRKLPGTP